MDWSKFPSDVAQIAGVVPLALARAPLILLLSLVFGTLFALLNEARIPVIRQILAVYASCFRGVPILVQRTTMDETLDVEAKSHVELFHHLFFTLAPDDKYINYTMEKAMYLVDETGLAQFNALKEKGFYNNIMGTSAVFSIFCDSIKFDKQQMTFTYYGRQRIERRTNILMRKLVTAGELKRVPRTENNPHGLLITNWRTLLNQDLEQKQKTIY